MASPNFTDSQLTKWAQTYENELLAKYGLIADRISLPIISGQNEYELPNYVTNIRLAIYQGKELHPKGGRSSILTGDTPFETQGSIPYEYVFSGKGLRVVKLYPTPMDNLLQWNSANFPSLYSPYLGLWDKNADENCCIFEFWRTADFTTSDIRLPVWLRRYLLKDYICFKAFNSEGPGQDLRAALYYQGRMQAQEEYLKKILGNSRQGKMSILYETSLRINRKPGRPILPSNFGYPLNY